MAPVDSRDERDSSDPLIGRLLDGRYRVGARIARGGMASVYEAMDVRLDRVVAVKVMHPGMGDDGDFAARFVREARAAARLSHPHVVAVHDQGDDHGTVFLVMEYIPGHTLRDVIRSESPMAPGKALALLEPVLSALAAAHRAGLIHRDIKPENVLIADDGRVKVADFGLAKAVSADTQHTATGGVLIGTVSYLAPELVVDGRADARADVYAAGVVLYELLTGRKPHEGESPIQVAYKHVHEDIPAPSALVRGGLPAYVDALVARATARDRSLRPADAQVLLHQLHRVKHAVDAGITDDPDLLDDLALPVASVYEEEQFGSTSEIPVPAAPAAAYDDYESTGEYDEPATALVATHQPNSWERDRPRRSAVFLIGGLVLALAIALGAWWFGFARYTSTPGVIELQVAQAQAKIEDAGLEFDVAREAYDENVPAGSVISTDPGAGERILPGDTVEAVVSKGKERYQVPDLKEMTEDAAQAALIEARLTFGRSVPKYHAKVPEGQVITTTPAAGEWLKRSTAVDLVISRGPRPIKITDFTGKDAKTAVKWFKDRHLKTAVTEEFSDEVEKGKVISQDPKDGELFRDDTVNLVVSKGPELVEIPRLRAMGVEAARDRLEALGLKVSEKHADMYLGLGYVSSVSPGEGESVPKGSTVTLYLV
ncbi:Stk1 family PASTA domain-containing Ser/Thr kinase [Nocardioides cavernaquae]|uniref:non-specific serine/threonine protein kinase n=1 Tax=Nocardioides cavernaquae TaxID=2321396 RepID=A0A3A5H9U9_9ACTN|nr:Stk1 family PASTA domain-containing Ser/Thr kinase [Nocardioides cavernaquae]